jgi:hypothetical protein
MIAQEARNLTAASKNDITTTIYNTVIFPAIEKAAKEGKSSIDLAYSILRGAKGILDINLLKNPLKEMGYVVKYTNDQRDGDYLTISW